MEESFLQLITELEQFREKNDSSTTDRSHRMLNITHDTGEFLAVLVRAAHAQHVLEIGTSNGYSTLWLASGAEAIDGHVFTVEHSEFKVGLAAINFARSGLASVITQIQDEAGRVFANARTADFDFIFLDSERTEYPGWWPDIKRVLRPGGLIAADNAFTHFEELAPFVALVEADPEFIISTVPVGNGEFLAARAPRL
jgi:predicted O-methyltransferase YrrM